METLPACLVRDQLQILGRDILTTFMMNFHPMIFMVGLLFVSSCKGHSQDADIFKTRREQMVRQQIEARGIRDERVLDAMRKVERHLFMPSELASRAYGDFPLPIGYDQTISQPYIVAFMTEALDLEPADKVLEVGTGSGYQAAILAEICDTVYTIEIVPELAARAESLLKVLHYDNVLVRTGDGYQGWPEHSPFDAIIVTCSPTHVPEPLVAQLAEGGKMIIPVGEQFNQSLVLMEKRKGRLSQTSVLAVRFVPMVDENQKEY
ncbi:MAG: protein-L-isoaspartate(D-aspartate) O-methyltransferase [Bacteroidales bacterium]|nr:protein-L-isoaspartate(D-aspartate) O-methyltransferase [Bacteroidales bacterium]